MYIGHVCFDGWASNCRSDYLSFGYLQMTHDREQVWRTADGRDIAVKDMQLSHLVNVINWVLDNPQAYPTSVRDLMIDEANYRKVFLFAEGKEYPQLVGNRWRMINPQTGAGRIEKPPADYIEAVKDNQSYQVMREKTQRKRNNKQQDPTNA